MLTTWVYFVNDLNIQQTIFSRTVDVFLQTLVWNIYIKYFLEKMLIPVRKYSGVRQSKSFRLFDIEQSIRVIKIASVWKSSIILLFRNLNIESFCILNSLQMNILFYYTVGIYQQQIKFWKGMKSCIR